MDLLHPSGRCKLRRETHGWKGQASPQQCRQEAQAAAQPAGLSAQGPSSSAVEASASSSSSCCELLGDMPFSRATGPRGCALSSSYPAGLGSAPPRANALDAAGVLEEGADETAGVLWLLLAAAELVGSAAELLGAVVAWRGFSELSIPFSIDSTRSYLDCSTTAIVSGFIKQHQPPVS